MSFVCRLFARLIVRAVAREPVRTALTIFAVALGVGVVIAIDLAGQAAAGNFHASLESLSGKADLIITANGGIDEKLLGRLAQLPYAFEFTPRIESFASINGHGGALPFIGLDLIAQAGSQEFESEGPDADYISPLAHSIWVGNSLGFHQGDSVGLLINDRIWRLRVGGVLKSRQSEIGDNDAIVADIGLAQKLAGKSGKLDSIDVRIPPGESVEYWRKLLQRNVPAWVSVAPQGTRTEENRKMLAAFRWNLTVLSYIALIVGAFLIYNTISISVVRRRAEIGILRALGATRGAIAAGFIGESLVFAVSGSVIGILIGRGMALGAVRLIGNTVQSLYVTSESAPVVLSLRAAGLGIALGIFASVVAALAPAFEAARVAPVEAMARGREQYVAQIRSRRWISWAALMLIAGAMLSSLPPVHGAPVCGYIAVFLLIAATCLAIPSLVGWFALTVNGTLEKVLGVEALLAMRSLRASIARTSVLTAALATAIAMTASVGIMVGSFRATVWYWVNDHLKADLFLRPAASGAADRHPILSADIADAIERLPGIAAVDRFRAYPISYQGWPATLAGSELSRVSQLVSTSFLPGENRDRILSELRTGDYAIVSEPFANKHHVRSGDTIELPIGTAVRKLQVLGIYYDYSTERGFITVDRKTLLKDLPDAAASNLAVYLKPGVNAAEARREIDRILGGRAVLVFSNSTLRRGAIDIFDRAFRITYALEAIAILVAIMGIAGALLAIVIDRRREFAVLRFLGCAQPQIKRIILSEAGLLGLFATAIGLILGTLLSLILIFVINKQSFGWTIQFHLPVAALIIATSGIYLATVLAGLYPARMAVRLNPVEVIHEE